MRECSGAQFSSSAVTCVADSTSAVTSGDFLATSYFPFARLSHDVLRLEANCDVEVAEVKRLRENNVCGRVGNALNMDRVERILVDDSEPSKYESADPWRGLKARERDSIELVLDREGEEDESALQCLWP